MIQQKSGLPTVETYFSIDTSQFADSDFTERKSQVLKSRHF